MNVIADKTIITGIGHIDPEHTVTIQGVIEHIITPDKVDNYLPNRINPLLTGMYNLIIVKQEYAHPKSFIDKIKFWLVSVRKTHYQVAMSHCPYQVGEEVELKASPLYVESGTLVVPMESDDHC